MVHQVWRKPKLVLSTSRCYMAITGTKEIDFTVYKNEALDIEIIKFEKERWHKESLLLFDRFTWLLVRTFMAYSIIIGKHLILNKKVTFSQKKGLIKIQPTLYKQSFTSKQLFHFSREWAACEKWLLFLSKGTNVWLIYHKILL